MLYSQHKLLPTPHSSHNDGKSCYESSLIRDHFLSVQTVKLGFNSEGNN